jgi:hypothetical protein
MTISAECTVCTDQLTNEDHISACPCGHTFHQNCLQQWITQCRNQPVCPFCRAKAPRKSVIQQLFFNAPNTSISSQDSPSSALSKMRNQVSTLQTQVAEIRTAKAKAEENRAEIEEKLKKVEKEKDKIGRKLDSKTTTFNLAKIRCQTYEEENIGYRNREAGLIAKVKKLENIEKNVEMMNQIKMLENGQEATPYVARLYNSNETDQIKRFSDQIQRAYQDKCNQMRRSEREMLNLKKDNSRYSRMLEKHANQIKTLEIKLNNAEKSLELSREKAKFISRADADVNCSLYNRLVAESPLSDDVIAKARAKFATPKMNEIGSKRKSSEDEKFGNFDKIRRTSADHRTPADQSPTGNKSRNLFDSVDESPFSDNTLFEEHFKSESKPIVDLVTPVLPKIISKKGPREYNKKLMNAFVFSSDEETEETSPIIESKIKQPAISRDKPLSHDQETNKIKRIKVKPRNPNPGSGSGFSPKKKISNLDVSKMVRESNLFKENRKRTHYPNGLGGSSKQTISKKLPSKTRKPNIADFFKNTKLQ